MSTIFVGEPRIGGTKCSLVPRGASGLQDNYKTGMALQAVKTPERALHKSAALEAKKFNRLDHIAAITWNIIMRAFDGSNAPIYGCDEYARRRDS